MPIRSDSKRATFGWSLSPKPHVPVGFARIELIAQCGALAFDPLRSKRIAVGQSPQSFDEPRSAALNKDMHAPQGPPVTSDMYT